MEWGTKSRASLRARAATQQHSGSCYGNQEARSQVTQQYETIIFWWEDVF
jgi:hypothetical protein